MSDANVKTSTSRRSAAPAPSAAAAAAEVRVSPPAIPASTDATSRSAAPAEDEYIRRQEPPPPPAPSRTAVASAYDLEAERNELRELLGERRRRRRRRCGTSSPPTTCRRLWPSWRASPARTASRGGSRTRCTTPALPRRHAAAAAVARGRRRRLALRAARGRRRLHPAPSATRSSTCLVDQGPEDFVTRTACSRALRIWTSTASGACPRPRGNDTLDARADDDPARRADARVGQPSAARACRTAAARGCRSATTRGGARARKRRRLGPETSFSISRRRSRSSSRCWREARSALSYSHESPGRKTGIHNSAPGV